MDQSGTALCDELGGGHAEKSRPARVLFVCTGNICRSAFAEACLRNMLTSSRGVEVSSAGIMAVAGRGMDPLMAEQARLLGIDPSGHRARQLTGRMLKAADIALVFGPEHVEWIAAEYPEHLDRVMALGQVTAVLGSQPRRAAIQAEDLVSAVRWQRPESAVTDWIADPHGRGRMAAQRVAGQIQCGVDVLATRTMWSN